MWSALSFVGPEMALGVGMGRRGGGPYHERWSSADIDVAIEWVTFKMRLERFNSVQSLSPV